VTLSGRVNMTRIVVKSKVDNAGMLHLNLPVGMAEAGKDVQVTVESAVEPMTPEEWRQFVLSTAGKWQGEWERLSGRKVGGTP
jgi:hypothetical protein